MHQPPARHQVALCARGCPEHARSNQQLLDASMLKCGQLFPGGHVPGEAREPGESAFCTFEADD